LKNIDFGFYFKKVKSQVSVVKCFSKSISKPPKDLAFNSLNEKSKAILAIEIAGAWNESANPFTRLNYRDQGFIIAIGC